MDIFLKIVFFHDHQTGGVGEWGTQNCSVSQCSKHREWMQKMGNRVLQGLLLFVKCWSGKMPFDGYNYMLMSSITGVWR